MESALDARFAAFLREKRLRAVKRLGKGWSSEIFLVRNAKGGGFALKIERGDSPRHRMAERESENLRAANGAGVGPKLAGFDLEKRAILMEFVRGKTFGEWLFSNPGKRQLEGFLKELLRQAKALDAAGLDHGQLAGKGANILVRKKKGEFLPVIIDFEKASAHRKCHNTAVIEAFLFRNPHGAAAKRVRQILGAKKCRALASR